ncbi:FecR family protein [Flectobacillus sp. DC10W]|uniref:FecR family protein n=1 Tax=Flectobacillus longus TaxID=2984207 RepID=A0ABT6YIJ4_9BACT|nr:FecR family protein [Flectobacillus longus]MDI9863414.1 FecR family protein [Flectobacillus longus]
MSKYSLSSFIDYHKYMQDRKLLILFEKYQQGKCSPAEKILIEQWLDSLTENTDESLEKEIAKEVALKSKMYQQIQARLSEETPARIIPFGFNKIARIAASVLLVMGCVFALSPMGYDTFDLKNETFQAFSVGKTKKVILEDGSIIWLKGNSLLTYPEHFVNATREVNLIGEALFEVAKDASHPFIVHSNGMNTKVLGTSFNIRPIGNHVEVVVFTGKVAVSLANGSKHILVLPSEKAICMPQEKEIKAATAENTASYLLNTEYNMSFEDARMSDVLEKISTKFDVDFELTNNTIGNCLITADFTDQSLDKTMTILCQIMNGSYVIEGNKVFLKAEGCR